MKYLFNYKKYALVFGVVVVALFGVNAYNSRVMAKPQDLEATPALADYDQLERAAAWLYATSVLGYSRGEAADILDFSRIPMRYARESQITIMTDIGTQEIDLDLPSNNPDLAEWRTNETGIPTVEYSYGGCFHVGGGEADYLVACQYFATYTDGYHVADVNEKSLLVGSNGYFRRSLWFGYDNDETWIFLGYAKENKFDLSNVQPRAPITPAMMAESYDIEHRPLPSYWLERQGREFEDAFMEELKGVQG